MQALVAKGYEDATVKVGSGSILMGNGVYLLYYERDTV